MSHEASPVSSVTSSRFATSAAGDEGDYDDEELRFIWDTVARAEATLPYLPPSSRHPTNALFRAYEELLQEQNVQPLHGVKLDKLLFKIGGSRDGTTITEKFHAVMARMNITLLLDIDEVTEDGYSYRSDESYKSDRADDADPPHQIAIEKTATAFIKYRDRLHSLQRLQIWQERAAQLKNVTDLFVQAREQDSRADIRDIFVAWHEIAAEVDEMPLDDLPANVYSRRIEKIATRTHEIKSTRHALDLWIRRAAGHARKHMVESSQISQEEEDELFKDDPKLMKLAYLTHQYMTKSRAVALWSNRASEEREKVEVARKAHEMGLKAKVFGMRQNPPLFAGLRKRLEDKVAAAAAAATPVQDTSEQPRASSPSNQTAQPTQAIVQPEVRQSSQSPPSNQASYRQPRKLDSYEDVNAEQRNKLNFAQQATVESLDKLTASREATSRLSNKLAVSASQMPVLGLAKNVDFIQVPAAAQQDEFEDNLEDELDERTLLAKRHLTRFRVFNAWESYTHEHKTVVEQVATCKAIESWCERSAELAQLTIALKHGRPKERKVVQRWKWHRVKYEKKLGAKALEFKQSRQKSIAKSWQIAAHEAVARKQKLEQTAIMIDRQRATQGIVQEWKACGRASAILSSMKIDGVKMWRDTSARRCRREEELDHMAHRVGLWHIKKKFLPAWKQAAKEAAQDEKLLQLYGDKADFYSLTTNATKTWRVAAQKKKKARISEAYLETRRTIKKAAGARCINRWRDVSASRHENLAVAHEEVENTRDWNAQGQAVNIWRVRAAIKAHAEAGWQIQETRRYAEDWTERVEGLQQLQYEAEEHFEAKAMSRTVKQWKLSSLQLESRRSASERHINKDRKQLKHGFLVWHAKAVSKRPTVPVIQAEVEAEAEAEAEDFLSTPGRPRLLTGGLRQTTTPLGPIPQRQTWQGAGAGAGGRERGQGPADSLLGRSLPGGTASRSARPKRNLRVSWADRG